MSGRIIAHFVTAGLLIIASEARGSERRFLSGYAGTIPPRDSDRARTYFEKPEVRTLLGRLESASLSTVEVHRVLQGSGASEDDLLRVGILRRDGDRLAIGFAYFTAADMETIHAVADRAGSELAAEYRRRKSEFQHLLAHYPSPGVPKGELAFVLLAGFSLNWDGLEVTREMGLRRPRTVEGRGFRYSFWAAEDIPGRDYREIYWGSSSFPLPADSAGQPGTFTFSSFGDPVSDPRMNFPDLAYLQAGALTPRVRTAAERIGLTDWEEMGQKFSGILGGNVLRRSADVLFALHRTPLSDSRIALITGGDPSLLIHLLEEIGYVERGRRGLYRLRVPVLDESDAPMVDTTLALSHAIMRSWLRERAPELQKKLSGLTAIRTGLSFAEVFTQVWHEIFGATTRALVHDGVIADAYGPGARSRGSFSVLWRPSLHIRLPGS